jgi:hypothetical protein
VLLFKKPRTMKINDELFNILLDKGLLALIILIVGFYFNRLIEKIRLGNSRIIELERLKGNLENDLLKDKRLRKLTYLEKQLSEFYWPIFIRLQKDNVLWERVPNFFDNSNSLPQETNDYLEKEVLLRNHEEIGQIIESNFHLAEADSELSQEIFKYIRHVTVYLAIRKVNNFRKLNPIDFNEPFPPNFISLFNSKLSEIQNSYNDLVSEIKSNT